VDFPAEVDPRAEADPREVGKMNPPAKGCHVDQRDRKAEMGPIPDSGWIPVGTVYGIWFAFAVLEVISRQIFMCLSLPQ
jgi:hypothetical protein